MFLVYNSKGRALVVENLLKSLSINLWEEYPIKVWIGWTYLNQVRESLRKGNKHP